MKILITALLLAVSGLKAQQKLVYYPHMREIFLTDKNKEYNNFVYEKSHLLNELLKIIEKTYYSDFYFSNNTSGTSIFQSMSLVPLQQNIENLFSPGITLQLLGDRDTHIGFTYTHDFENEDYDQKVQKKFSHLRSTIRLNKEDKTAVSFPLHLLNPAIKDPNLKGSFFLSQIDTFISKDRKVTFTAEGKFSKAFYLKNGEINSLLVQTLVFEFINDELLIKAVYPVKLEDSGETQTDFVVFKAPFKL